MNQHDCWNEIYAKAKAARKNASDQLQKVKQGLRSAFSFEYKLLEQVLTFSDAAVILIEANRALSEQLLVEKMNPKTIIFKLDKNQSWKSKSLASSIPPADGKEDLIEQGIQPITEVAPVTMGIIKQGSGLDIPIAFTQEQVDRIKKASEPHGQSMSAVFKGARSKGDNNAEGQQEEKEKAEGQEGLLCGNEDK